MKPLTSWKEIAAHLGKGVRTVQRYEALGLPVRRPANRSGVVLAFPIELDTWARQRTMHSFGNASKPRHSNELAHLRRLRQELRESRLALQRTLHELVNTCASGIPPRHSSRS